MSAVTFDLLVNKYVDKLFKSFYGKKLSVRTLTPEDIKKALKAAYRDGVNDALEMYKKGEKYNES